MVRVQNYLLWPGRDRSTWADPKSQMVMRLSTVAAAKSAESSPLRLRAMHMKSETLVLLYSTIPMLDWSWWYFQHNNLSDDKDSTFGWNGTKTRSRIRKSWTLIDLSNTPSVALHTFIDVSSDPEQIDLKHEQNHEQLIKCHFNYKSLLSWRWKPADIHRFFVSIDLYPHRSLAKVVNF